MGAISPLALPGVQLGWSSAGATSEPEQRLPSPLVSWLSPPNSSSAGDGHKHGASSRCFAHGCQHLRDVKCAGTSETYSVANSFLQKTEVSWLTYAYLKYKKMQLEGKI